MISLLYLHAKMILLIILAIGGILFLCRKKITAMWRFWRHRLEPEVIFSVALAVCVLLTVIIAFGLKPEGTSFWQRIFFGISVAADLLAGNGEELRLLAWENLCLRHIVWGLSLAVPFLMAGTIMILVIRCRPRRIGNAERYYIFSQMDARSIELTKSIQEHYAVKGKEVWTIPVWSEYERRSSLAAVYHAAYHIASLSQNHTVNPDHYAANYAAKQEAVNETEHRRWANYVRCEGMESVDLSVTSAYYHQVHDSHVDVVGQLTPCLVDYSQLDDLYQNLCRQGMGPGNAIPFRKKDHFIARNADAIYRIMTSENPEIALDRSMLPEVQE